MFDIGWGEFLVIGIVALIAIGPKELPGVLRGVGQWMSKIRRMAAEFQGQFQEAMREAEMTELKKQVDEMTTTARSVTHYDPLNPDGLGERPTPAQAAADNTGGAVVPVEGQPLPVPTEPASPPAPVQPADDPQSSKGGGRLP